MKRRSGFTLMEVLIATMIMVVVLATLVYGLSQCSNLTETVRNQDAALNAAQAKLEEIANSDLSYIMSYNGTTFNVTGLPSNAQGWVGVSKASTYTNDLYNVTVKIIWQQRGGRRVTRALTTTFIRIL